MTVTELDQANTQGYAAEQARLRRELAAVYRLVARQFEGDQSDDDYSNDAAPNLAWDAMLRLAERLYPDHKD